MAKWEGGDVWAYMYNKLIIIDEEGGGRSGWGRGKIGVWEDDK